MTSQKRKSSLPGTTAKRQKLNEESQCPSVTCRTRNGVTNKSKSTQFSTQKKKKPISSANKAIKKSNLSQSEKDANVKVTKKNTVKNVPTKEKVLRITKDLTNLKRKAEKSSDITSKVARKSQSRVAKTEARKTSVQNKTSKTKNLNKSVTRIKTECLKKNSIIKNKNKTHLKSIQAKKIAKTTQNKAKRGDKQLKLNEQSKRIKQTSLNLKKRAPIVKTPEKNTKVDCKKVSNKPPHTSQKLTSRHRTADKPSKQIQQKLVNSLSKKNKKSTEIEVTKRLTLRTRVKTDNVKVESETTPTVGVCLIPKKENKTQSGKLSSNIAKKEVTINGQSGSSSSSNSSKKIAIKGKNKTVLSTVPSKSKRDKTKPVVKATSNKVKKQKDVKTEAEKNKQDTYAEGDQKSKRISILELCNEIAGEIESDTVEVTKEGPSAPNNPVEEKLVENSEHSPMEVLPPCPALESPVNQSKRFFPSRKPSQLKCKIEQKTSPGINNYKWKKIKQKKNFSQNNILRNQAVLPNLEMIRAKISPVRQLATNVSNHPKSSSETSETTLTTHVKLNKTILSRMVKNNSLQKLVPKNVSVKPSTENGLLENQIKHDLEIALDEGFRLHLESSPENSPMKQPSVSSSSPEVKPPGSDGQQLTEQMAAPAETGKPVENRLIAPNSKPLLSDQSIQKEIRKLREADKDSNSQPIIDAGQKRFGAISCNMCGMLYTASNPEDETQHLLFHNQFISAVKYVGWKKERIVAEYPDGKIIMVLPDDPKYALKKVEEIREMVDNDLGFQQVPLQLHSRTKTLLFISSDKKVVGCLIAEHIQWGYRVIDDFTASDSSEKDQLISERVKAWCCSITPEPAICGVSRMWVFSMMRRKKIASRLLECLRNHFIYGSHLNKDEIAFSDPTPDGKLFATHYCGTSQFLVYNFVSGHQGR